TRDKYYRRIKIWCCYKCDYYSSSLSPSFLTKRRCLYGNPLALMANGFLQQSRPITEQAQIFFKKSARFQNIRQRINAASFFERASSNHSGRSEEHTSELQSRFEFV